MDNGTEVIREQMEETKSHISEKLESLEQQVSQTVHSTGNAVNATVETVQESIETVTNTVKDAMQSVVNAFDVTRQVQQHPWMMVGGAVALGYLANEIWMRPNRAGTPFLKTASAPDPTTDNRSHPNDSNDRNGGMTPDSTPTPYDHSRASPSWVQLQNVALSSLTDIVHDIAARAVPSMMDYLTGKGAVAKAARPAEATEQERSPNRSAF